MKLGDKEINIEVTRKNRKTISLRITDSGGILISAPLFMKDKDIKEFIVSKKEWISGRIRLVSQRKDNAGSYEDGIKYLDETYAVCVYETASSTAKVIFDSNKFNVFIPNNLKEFKNKAIGELLEGWYRQRSRVMFEERVKYYGDRLKVHPERIAVKDQKTRWGSCSSKGNINFNYRIIMAPLYIVDYLVVHELCHLIELNHSKAFWDLVEGILPNYRQCMDWLKENGSSLKLKN